MKLKDLNETTVYAYRTSKYHTPRRIQVLDASQLYISSRRRTSDSTPVPASPGARATIGTGYYGSTIGVLYREADKPTEAPQLAMPQHIVGTWEEVSKQEEQAKAERLASDKRMADFRRQNELDAQHLRELMLAHPEFWPSVPYVDTYNSTQSIRTSLLIQILEALPSHV
jgi:hypothetical protein